MLDRYAHQGLGRGYTLRPHCLFEEFDRAGDHLGAFAGDGVVLAVDDFQAGVGSVGLRVALAARDKKRFITYLRTFQRYVFFCTFALRNS